MTPDKPTRSSSWRGVVHRTLLLVFIICAAAWLISLSRETSTSDYSDIAFPAAAPWLTGLLVILAAASTLAGLARNLPIENSLMAGIFVAGIAGTVQLVGAKTGLPFGHFTYAENFGPRIFNILPWPMPLLWGVIILNSRDVARLILRPCKLAGPGYWTLGLTSLLAVATDLSLEPFAVNRHLYWAWQTRPIAPVWYTTPLINFSGWTVTTLLALVFTSPWLINKKPVKPPGPDFHPLFLWLTINLLLIIANAANKLWPAVGLGLPVVLLVLTLTLRGAFWRAEVQPS